MQSLPTQRNKKRPAELSSARVWPGSPPRLGLWGDLLKLAVVGLAYYAAAKIGLGLALVGENVTPVWPPTGIALVALLVFGARVWPAIAMGAFLVNARISPSLLAAAVIAVGNTLAPLLAAHLLARAGFRRELSRLRDAMALVFLAGLLSMLVSALIGTSTLVFSEAVPGSAFLATMAVWWTGDAMGVLVVAPLLLHLRIPRLEEISWRRAGEAFILFAGMAVVCWLAFNNSQSFLYLVFPFLLWASWRFQQRGAVPAVLLVSGIAISAAIRGSGPFADATLFEKMVTLQVFNGVVALTSFMLAAVTTERIQARAALQRAADELGERIRNRTSELTAMNERLELEIAERRQTEYDLRKTWLQLTEAQQIASIGSWEWDIKADKISWTDELYRIYGMKPQEFEPTYESFLERIHPEDREFVNEHVQRAFADSTPFSFDHRIIRPDGTQRIMHGRGEVIVDSSGAPVRMAGTAQDITERKRVEEESERAGRELAEAFAIEHEALEKLQQLDELKSDFLSTVSHELRTPLTSIQGFSSLLISKNSELQEGARRDFLERIEGNAKRLGRLINELLDFSGLEGGVIDVEIGPCDLAEEVNRVIENLGTVPDAHRIEVRLPSGIAVLADPKALSRILGNLLTNALKFSPATTPIVVEAAESLGEIRIEVEDEGPGVPAAERERIFERFYRVDRLETAAAGTGIGLAVAKRYVEAQGGRLWVEERPGGGSVFCFTLKRAAPSTGEAAQFDAGKNGKLAAKAS